MKTKMRWFLIWICTMTCLLAACTSTGQKFVAPAIDPPADLIPGYLPVGFTLIQGFKFTRHEDVTLEPGNENGGDFILHLKLGDPLFAMKSPNGDPIQGVYYQGKENLILITKVSYPGGTLDTWRAEYEESFSRPCECSCLELRIAESPLFERMNQIQEVRTIGTTQVAVLQGVLGTATVFMRGDDLLVVESGLSLEENLKIVESLLQD